MVGALVAFVLLGIAAMMMAKGFSAFSRGAGRLDRRVQAAQLLTNTAQAFATGDYASLVGLCQSKNAFAIIPPGQCVAAGALNRTLLSPAGLPLTRLEVLRDWNGASSALGVACVQLERCQRLAAGHMLEVTFRGYWDDPSANNRTNTAILSMRRVAW